MADENITITIREDGARVVKRNLDDVASSAENTSSMLDLLRDALAGLAIAEVVKEFIELADTFANMQNRLRLVTQSTAELNVVNQELYRIANATRQSYEATVETYSRVALTAQSLGASQKDLLAFTENLNKAIAISGVTGYQAKNGMVQLAEGMAAGTLQGQHLRALLVDIPILGQVLADHLGVPRGELKKLGEEGKITSQVLLAALADANNGLAEKFAKTVPTISQAFEVLKNHVLELVGSFSSGNGITQALANSLLFVADHLDMISRFAAAAAVFIGVNLAAFAIPKAIAALVELGAAALANPFTAMAEILLIVIGLIVAFGDKIQIGGGHLANLQDLAVAVWNNITGAVQAFLTWFNKNFAFISQWVEAAFGKSGVSLTGFLQLGAKVVDFFVGNWLAATGAILAAFQNFGPSLSELITEILNGIAVLVTTFINGVIDALNAVGKAAGLGKIDSVQLQLAQQSGTTLGTEVGKAFAKGFQFSGAEDALNSLLSDADKVAAARIQKAKEAKAAEEAARDHLGDHGPSATVPDDGKAAAAAAKLEGALGSLLSKVDPVSAGLLKLAKDRYTLNEAMEKGIISDSKAKEYMAELEVQSHQDILGGILEKADPTKKALIDLALEETHLHQARAAGLVTAQQEIQYLAQLKSQYAEATDPLKFMTDELNKQIKAAGEDTRARQIDDELRQRSLELHKKGIDLTKEETDALRAQLVTLQQTNESQGIRNGLLAGSVEKRRTDALGIDQVSQLRSDPKSGFTKDDATNALNQNLGGNLFQGTNAGNDAQLASYQQMYAKIAQMRQKNLIDEQTASQLKAKVDVQVNQQRLASANQFFGTLSGLTTSKNKELAAIGKAAAIAQATIDGVLAVQKALSSAPYPANLALAAAVGAISVANVAKIAGVGFESGGYTGNTGTKEVAGVVHGQEFVVKASQTAQYRPLLESINNGTFGRGYSDGGYVTPISGSNFAMSPANSGYAPATASGSTFHLDFSGSNFGGSDPDQIEQRFRKIMEEEYAPALLKKTSRQAATIYQTQTTRPKL